MATTTSKVSPVGNNYYKTSVTTNADGSLSATTFRTDAKGGGAVAVSTVNTDANGKSTRTYASGASDAEKKAFADPNSPERKAYTQQVQSQNPYGANPTAEQTKRLNSTAGKPNAASAAEGQEGQGSTPTIDEEKDAGTTKKDTRTDFPQGLKYPANLQIDHQDIIKFSILEYKPRSLSEPNSPLGGFNERSVWTSRVKGDVSLPIPGGITDTNAVSWGSDTLTAGQKAAGDLANSLITKGAEGGARTAERIAGQASEESSSLKTGLAAYFTEQAIGASNILSRTSGLVQNPNMELLFTGPSLRPFSFTFKLSARSVDDREQIRKIIRFFKQGMAVQRSEAQLFLKAPHTFKIQYLHKTKDHPYINLIKECALQSFTVNYTPEGNYMTFADGLMTSYEISMQFQEIEPIFNDDYTQFEKQNNLSKDAVIGY